jgi:hypothetical protein
VSETAPQPPDVDEVVEEAPDVIDVSLENDGRIPPAPEPPPASDLPVE